MKVLVIDDNHDITEVLSFYFEHENIDYELINNSKEGLKAIREHNFDLILLDMAMPGFSGIEIIRSLKKDGIFESRSIVLREQNRQIQSLIEEVTKNVNHVTKELT